MFDEESGTKNWKHQRLKTAAHSGKTLLDLVSGCLRSTRTCVSLYVCVV